MPEVCTKMAKRHASHLAAVVERLRRNAWPNRLRIASGRFPAGGHKWGDCCVVTVGAAGGGLVCFGRRGLMLPCSWMMCLSGRWGRVALQAKQLTPPAHYKAQLAGVAGLVHVTVEVNASAG